MRFGRGAPTAARLGSKNGVTDDAPADHGGVLSPCAGGLARASALRCGPTRVSMHKERARGGAIEDFYLAVEDVAITDENGRVWERAGVAIKDLSIEEPDLEDVFVELTA